MLVLKLVSLTLIQLCMVNSEMHGRSECVFTDVNCTKRSYYLSSFYQITKWLLPYEFCFQVPWSFYVVPIIVMRKFFINASIRYSLLNQLYSWSKFSLPCLYGRICSLRLEVSVELSYNGLVMLNLSVRPVSYVAFNSDEFNS